jgi:hypothetical protein
MPALVTAPAHVERRTLAVLDLDSELPRLMLVAAEHGWRLVAISAEETARRRLFRCTLERRVDQAA